MDNEVIAEVGGPIDETSATLGVHGPDLNPDEITAILGCSPSRYHRKGQMRPRGAPWSNGAWLLKVEGRAPVEPEDVIAKLLDQLPTDPALWRQLHERFTVQFGIAVYVIGWTQGFALSNTLLARIAALGVELGVTVYCEADEQR